MDLEQRTDTTLWCAGLPLVEERPLTEDEMHALRTQRLRARLRGIAFWAGGVICFLAMFPVSFLLMDTHPELFFLPLLCLLLAVLLPVLAKDAMRYARLYQLELADGRVRLFRGRVGTSIKGSAQAVVLAHKLLRRDVEDDQTLELMAATGRVLRANGQTVKRLTTIECEVVAVVPEYAQMAAEAQWMDVLEEREDGGRVLINQRELTDAECQEMHKLARAARTGGVWVTVALTLWLCIPVTIMVVDRQTALPKSPAFYILLVLVILGWSRTIKRIRFARMMDRSIEGGHVIILRAPSDDAPEDTVVEVLPHCKMITWTVNGVPADWRTGK